MSIEMTEEIKRWTAKRNSALVLDTVLTTFLQILIGFIFEWLKPHRTGQEHEKWR